MTKVPISNVYYLLCYALGHAQQVALVDAEEVDQLDRVVDLFGKVLAEGTTTLLRRGLDRSYREFREDLPGIRGKLEIAETTKRGLRARGLASCRFEDLTHDVIHNRILKSSLLSLLREDDLDGPIRDQVRLVASKFGGIGTVPLSREVFRRVQLDRNRRAYSFLLSVCSLIHDRRLVNRGPGAKKIHDFDETSATLWRLFEDFVLGFYRHEQTRFRVNPEGRSIAWFDREGVTPEDEAVIPRMVADGILDSPDRRVIVDAKFYSNPRVQVSDRPGAGKLKIESHNLYQLLAYLRNRDRTHPEGPRHEGLLLYPVVEHPFATSFRLEGFQIAARGIDLTQPWKRIHQDMFAALGLDFGRKADRDTI